MQNVFRNSDSQPSFRRIGKKRSYSGIERLEQRQLLTADVIISEVLASNSTDIDDGFGAKSDWIELYNKGHETADLTGWFLTDEANDRTKWIFPAASLEPGESMVVFASGEDRVDPDGNPHTNFKITSSGEYLGLYQQDGRTLAYEFDILPQQFADISYGTGQVLAERTLVSLDGSSKVLLPGSVAEDMPVQQWTSPDFDDTQWSDRVNQLGYDDDKLDGDFNPLIAENGQLSMRGKTSSAYVRTTFNINGEFLPTYEELKLDINYDDGFVAYLNGETIASVNAPELLAFDSVAIESHGGIADAIGFTDFSSAADQAEFTILGDAAYTDGVIRLTAPQANQNGAAWKTNPVSFGSDYTFSSAMVFDIHTPGGGVLAGDSDGQGGEGMTFVLQSNDNNVLGSGGDSLGLENTGSTFLAIELDSGADGAFDPDDKLPSHLGINTNIDGSVARTAIKRFNGNAFFGGTPLPGGEGYQYLWVDYHGATKVLDVFYATTDVKPTDPTLSTTIDLSEHFGQAPSLFAGWTGTTSDAFNGHDVVSFNIITGVGELGRDPVTIDLRDHIGKLKTGKNVLAFHGLNLNQNDEDFLLIPQLTAKEVTLTDTVAYFGRPTPGALNGEPTGAPSVGVNFSVPTKLFVDAFDVTISAESENVVIRYTTDGKVPDENSTPYSGPITVTESIQIRARAFEPDRSAGPISTAGFTQLTSDLTEFENGKVFESNLPIIVFDSFGSRRIDSDSLQLQPSSGIFFDPGADGIASLLDEPQYAGLVGARIRGQSSQGWAKKQYALEIIEDGEFDASQTTAAIELQDKQIDIFGFPTESDWVLNGPYSDKTQLNNFLTFNWYNQIGTYAPRARLVEVFVNANGDGLDFKSGNSGDYRGTYVMLEKIKIDNQRVDITPIQPGDNTEPNITGGYIWKKDKDGANDVDIRTGRQAVKLVEPGREAVTDEQVQWLDDHITEFEDVLYGDNFRDPNEGYAKYIDVRSWADTWLMVEFTKNIDGFRLSTYYHKDRGGKIKQGPAWDYNLSLGNGNYLNGADPEGWYHDGISQVQYPYWDRLFEDPAFSQAVSDRWAELRRTAFTTENLLADIDSAVDLISNGNPNLDRPANNEPSNPISRNYDRWTNGSYATDIYHWPNCFFGQGACPRSPLPGARSPQDYGDYISIMKWFVENRVEWMDSELVSPVLASLSPGVVERGSQLTLAGPAGFELFYTTDGSDPQQPLVIAEDTIVIDANNAVEYIVPTDDSLIVHCDDGVRLTAADRCFMNPDYVLGTNGETWGTGTLGIGYDQGADFNPWITTDIGGDARGVNGSTYLRIPFEVSEALEQNAEDITLDVRYDDGFVVYSWMNSLGTPVEVARSNAPGSARHLPIRAQAFNAVATESRSDDLAIEFASFDLSGARTNLKVGTNYLIVQLLNDDANSDDLLFDIRMTISTERTTVSPSVTRYTGPITIDENTQLFARGFSETREEWTSGFRGAYVVNLPELQITEINYNPAPPTQTELNQIAGLTNEDFEFVEIRNVGDTDANLIGTRFSNGINFEFGDVDLGSGTYGLLVKNEAAFKLRYGNDLTILGQYTDNLNNNGETLALVDVAGGLLTKVMYDDNDLFSEAADGVGATLQYIDGLSDKYYNWRPSTEFGGSPGAAGAAWIGVVVNEVLSNSADAPDAIELLNTNSVSVEIGNWFISDSRDELRKYQIPAGTTIGANQRFVISEPAFNSDPNDPHSFGLSGTNGDDLWLTFEDESGVVSFVDDVHFAAALSGESFSRVPDGTGRLAPTDVTLGLPNALPRVGPVVISEVNYHPTEPSAAALALDSEITAADLEFLEIHNPTAARVDLTDWRIRGGISLNFNIGESLAPNETVVVTPFNPASEVNIARASAFRAHYGMNQNVRLLGGYSGGLSSNYDRITLLSRDLSLIDQPIVLPIVIEDEIVYDDQAPWPVSADGLGSSLNRNSSVAYGNSATSWTASNPNPGQVTFSEFTLGDVDQNGIVDANDIDSICREIHMANPNARFDLNDDGKVNIVDQVFLVENILGTTIGDSNLDGIFNSSDLVIVSQTGGYEDTIDGNAGWATGDWDCDGDFGTRDLVAAFTAGGYSEQAVARRDESEVGAAIVDPGDKLAVGNSDVGKHKHSKTDAAIMRVLAIPTAAIEIENDRAFESLVVDSDLIDEDLLDTLATQ